MARTYRRVAAATDNVRRGLGALSAVSNGDVKGLYTALGYCQASLEAALVDLAAAGGMTDSAAFLEGYEDVSGLLEPIPFPED